MFKSQKVGAIIVAAGRGERMGGIDKIFAPLGSSSVLERVAGVFDSSPYIDNFVIVLTRDNLTRGQYLLAGKNLTKLTKVVPGGSRRQDSVEAGLKALLDCKWVVIHDGARPLVGAELITAGLEAAQETGAAVAAVPVTDTIKLVDEGGYVKETLPRSRLWAVQTPQVFRFDIIKEAYRNTSGDVTDDAALVEAAGVRVKLYMGAYDNIKLTTPADLALAAALWRRRGADMRIGMGYDVHRLAPGLPLVLGGIKIPHHQGLIGWSDADVLTHAVMDALLGAAALGDIGKHFPPGDPQYKGISSLVLLGRVGHMLKEAGYKVGNIDVTVVAEQPKLAPHIDAMRAAMSKALGCDVGDVCIQATTSEELGFVGREEGMVAWAIAAIEKI